MAQINFRVDNSIKLIMDILARNEGKSIAQIAKEYILKNIEPVRVDLAFNLLKEGKIGRKKAWKISCLEYSLFLKEWREVVLEITSRGFNPCSVGSFSEGISDSALSSGSKSVFQSLFCWIIF